MKPNLQSSDPEQKQKLALNYSLKYLSIRNRSTKEVSEYLARKGFDEEIINATLKKLVDLKFLNDEEFAKNWIESRQRNKSKSKYFLKQELRIKGVSDDSIEKSLIDAKDDLETARIAFEKKKRIYSNLNKLEFKKKMGSFLQRRGYSWEIISKLINE